MTKYKDHATSDDMLFKLMFTTVGQLLSIVLMAPVTGSENNQHRRIHAVCKQSRITYMQMSNSVLFVGNVAASVLCCHLSVSDE